MKVMGGQATEPGWYNDPDGVHEHQAYWDGTKWTGDTRSQPRRGLLLAATASSAVTIAIVVVLFNLGCDLIGLFALLGVGAVSGVASALLSTRLVRSTYPPPRVPRQSPVQAKTTYRFLLWASWLVLILYVAIALVSLVGFATFCG